MLLDSVISDVVLCDADFEKISQLVYEHCGINLHAGKKELVRARLAKRLRMGKFSSFSQYIDYVIQDTSGQEFSMLIDSISTNLTSFFREAEHFNYLTKVFLPALIERKRKAGSNKIRVWSAGCSSGEEPYSLAITLLDSVAGQGAWDIKILATDISTTILERAKAGIYDEKRIEPLTAGQKQKYLTCHRNHGLKTYEISSAVREAVIFRYVNLMSQWPVGGPIDFIFCRNVMIYFDKATQQKLVSRFHGILENDGLLFTGHSESLTGIAHQFKYVQPTIYSK